MSKYIDADRLVDMLKTKADMAVGAPKTVCLSVAKMVGLLPPVDVVPVVRCKDCRYWQDNNGGYPCGECKWRGDETPDADDYCSAGERE